MDAGRTREGFIAASVYRFHFVSGTLKFTPTKTAILPSYTTVNFRSELTRDMQPISRDRLLQIKFDKSYSNHSIAAKVIEEILAEDWSSGSTLNDAAEHLRGWNLATNAGNRHAALAAPSDSCSDGEQPKTISVSETSEIR